MKKSELLTRIENSNYAVIISAESAHHTYLNGIQTRKLQRQLQTWELYFYEVTDCYHNETEQSFVVICANFYDVARLMHQAFDIYHQESVLVLDSHNNMACLLFADVYNMFARDLSELCT